MKNIINYYQNELGINLKDLSHPISNKINSINEVSELDKSIKKHQLKALGVALMELRLYDDTLYKIYLKRIVNNNDISIHGHIFEIRQCAHFLETCRKEILDFKFGNSALNEPDFFVNNCGFEITSMRFLDETVEINPSNKLLNTFRRKNAKKYANSSTALLIDISEATYQTFEKNIQVSKSLNDTLQLMKKEMNFGVILCFIEWTEIIEEKIKFNGTVYPVYSDKCEIELKEIIEGKFIKGQMNEFKGKTFVSSN